MRLEIPALDQSRHRQFPIGRGVGVVGHVDDYSTKLYRDEQRYVGSAVPKRQREYASGRHFARIGLEAIGRIPSIISTAPSRSPVWPEDIVGSITHSDRFALVTIFPRGEPFAAVGVDMEVAQRVGPDLVPLVLTDDEQLRLHAGKSDPTLYFSAKEAVFKAIHPLVGLMIGFQDVEVAFDMDHGIFEAAYNGPEGANRIINMGFGLSVAYEGHWVCFFAIPAKYSH